MQLSLLSIIVTMKLGN